MDALVKNRRCGCRDAIRTKWQRSWVDYAELMINEGSRPDLGSQGRNTPSPTQLDSIEIMKALILVDIQNDFLPGGALAVPDGDKIIPIANRLQAVFPLVVATQDWHPANHGSFAASHPGKECI